MTSQLVQKSGIDKNGHAYTRMVRAEGATKNSRVAAVTSKSTAPKRQRTVRSNEEYASILDIETLDVRNSDSLDFHEVSIWGVRDMLDSVAKDSLGRGLTDDEMATIIFKRFRNREPDWDVKDLDGNSIEVDLSKPNNSDSLDFFEVSVWGVQSAIEDVKKLNRR